MKKKLEWMKERWWSAGALLLIFALVVKTSTVSAPIEASTIDGERGTDDSRFARPTFGPTFALAPAAIAQSRARAAETIRALEAELAIERAKSELLEQNVESLESRFDEVAALADELMRVERSAAIEAVTAKPVESVPIPVEAIFVRQER